MKSVLKAYSAGKLDELRGKPGRSYEDPHENDAYAMGRALAAEVKFRIKQSRKDHQWNPSEKTNAT